MSANTLIRTDHAQREAIIRAVLDTLDSPHSRRAYRRGLEDFVTWYAEAQRARLDKAAVGAYRQAMLDSGLTPSSVNQRLAAIKGLAREAAAAGAIPDGVAAAIASVKGVREHGHRAGNWLTQAQVQALLDAPDLTILRGVRDRALLAVLLGCGLRRAEASRLELAHVQQRDGRWVIADLVGKGQRVRTVPMPSWAKLALDAWTAAAGIGDGRVFRAIDKRGNVRGDGVTSQAIYNILRGHAAALGLELAPHDARRTFAKLAHKGGAPVDQIQLSLGHASIQTTERYLGVEQDLQDAPCDRLGLRLSV